MIKKILILFFQILLLGCIQTYGFNEQSLRNLATSGMYYDIYDNLLTYNYDLAGMDTKKLNLLVFPSDLVNLCYSGVNVLSGNPFFNYNIRIAALYGLDRITFGGYYYQVESRVQNPNVTNPVTTTVNTSDNNFDGIPGNSTNDITTTTRLSNSRYFEQREITFGAAGGMEINKDIKLGFGARIQNINGNPDNNNQRNDLNRQDFSMSERATLSGTLGPMTNEHRSDLLFYPQQSDSVFLNGKFKNFQLLLTGNTFVNETIEMNSVSVIRDFNPGAPVASKIISNGDGQNTYVSNDRRGGLLTLEPIYQWKISDNWKLYLRGLFQTSVGVQDKDINNGSVSITNLRPGTNNIDQLKWINYHDNLVAMSGNGTIINYGMQARNYITFGPCQLCIALQWTYNWQKDMLAGLSTSQQMDIEDDGDSGTYYGYGGLAPIGQDGFRTINSSIQFSQYDTTVIVNTFSLPVSGEVEISKGFLVRFGYIYSYQLVHTISDIASVSSLQSTHIVYANPAVSNPADTFTGAQNSTVTHTSVSTATIINQFNAGMSYALGNRMTIDIASTFVLNNNAISLSKIELSSRIRL